MQQLAPPGNVESIERSSTDYGERKEGSNFCWWYAGFKILASKDAKKVYTQTTAAVLRMKDCTMETVSRVQEEAGDILADAKAINEARAAAAEQEVIADDAAESAAE